MSLRVWLPLNGDLRNQGISDLSFTDTSGGALSITYGKIGKCYQRATFKTAGYIGSNKTMNFNGSFSITCWAYVMQCVGDTANGLVTFHSHIDHTGSGITVKQVSDSDYRISCNTGDGSYRTYDSYYGSTNIKNSWHHLGLTYNKPEKVLKLWVDGNVEYTLSNYDNASQDDVIRLFEWSTTYDDINYRPAAKLNDVRIYDHCLSAKEVKEISKGLTCHFTLSNPYETGTETVFSSDVIADSSGFGNDGTRSGTLSIDTLSPRNSRSFRFEETKYIKFPSPVTSPNKFSCSFWVYPISCGGYATITSTFDGPGSGFWITINCEGAGLWYYYNGIYLKSNKGLLSLGQWYHACFVYDNGIATWYQNGEPAGSADISANGRTLRLENYLALGNSYTGNTWNTKFGGSISDFRIYATALSASDIMDLYVNVASITKSGSFMTYEFKEETA